MKRYVLAVIFLILLFVPFIWSQNSKYSIGFDTGRIYYLFPKEYAINLGGTIIADNSPGTLGSYFPMYFLIPFSLAIYMLKILLPFLNTQSLLYGLNLAFGFLFFYLLLGVWIKEKDHTSFLIKITSSFFYIFSIFSIYSVWGQLGQFHSLYLVAIFPLLVYLFIKAVNENKIKSIISLCLILFFYSVFIWVLPWIYAFLLIMCPIFVFLFIKNKKRFMKISLLISLIFFLLNFYWIIYFLDGKLSDSNYILNRISDQNFISENIKLIEAVSSKNNLIYPLFNLFHKGLQEKFKWPSYEVYKNWNLKILPLNLLFLIIILAPLLIKSKEEVKKIYWVLFISWIFALFFFTVKIGNLGTEIFVWISKNLPGFVITRNMYDKFGLPLSFVFSSLLGIGLYITTKKFSNKKFKFVIITLTLLIILINAKPFILGEYYKVPIWSTNHTYNSISNFNHDFYDLTEYLKKQNESSHYLWLPINLANYVLISDGKLDNHYYSGTSPIQILTKKVDYNGINIMGSDFSYKRDTNYLIEELLFEKNYSKLGEFFQKTNVKYIILNKDISEDLSNSYLFSVYSKGDFFNAQNENFTKVILGEKIRDFGSRYSLYKINDSFKNEKIYLTNNLDVFPENFYNVQHQKLASYKYTIQIYNLSESSNLVFLDVYHEKWELYFKKDNKVLFDESHSLAFSYANSWALNSTYIKQNFPQEYYKENPDGSIDIELTLYFKPQSYFYLGLIISLATLLACIIYLLYSWRKERREERKDKEISLR